MKILVVVVAALLPCRPSQAADPPPTSSLDDQLLEGLNEGLDELLPPAQKPREPAGIHDNELDAQLLDELDGSKQQDPLSSIRGKMQRAGALLGQRRPVDEAQRLQQEIVAELDELLEKARQQAQKQQSNLQSEQSARRDQASQPDRQQSAQSSPEQDSKNPARDSEMRLRDRPTEQPDLATTESLMQELWGHLPERDRQQVINSTMETFVPKYELLIKEYFKRLAESTREQTR